MTATLDQYTIAGLIHTTGSISGKVPGAQVTGAAGLIQTSGSIDAGTPAPLAAFDDFAMFGLSDPDPAMVLVGANNGGAQTGGYGHGWARNYMLFTPPTDYPVSDGLAWPRAAFASLAWKYVGLDPNNWQYLEDVQFEELPLNLTAPTTYNSPRRIETTIKPDRLNLASTPSFEAGMGAWITTGSGTGAQDTTLFHGIGAASAKITATAGSGVYGTSLALPNLVVGRRYIASAWVQAGAPGLTLSVIGRSAVSGSTFDQPDEIDGMWRRVSLVWDAGSSTETLHLESTAPGSFWVDQVLVEEGDTLRDYFDGSFGDDYLWEAGGTAHLSRSYYYSQRGDKSYLVQTLLDENTPVGITAAEPLFAVPPSN